MPSLYFGIYELILYDNVKINLLFIILCVIIFINLLNKSQFGKHIIYNFFIFKLYYL